MANDDRDPGLSVDCPECGARLAFVASKPADAVFLYRCRRHGLFVVSPDATWPVPVPDN
jgi:hypothetical protein